MTDSTVYSSSFQYKENVKRSQWNTFTFVKFYKSHMNKSHESGLKNHAKVKSTCVLRKVCKTRVKRFAPLPWMIPTEQGVFPIRSKKAIPEHADYRSSHKARTSRLLQDIVNLSLFGAESKHTVRKGKRHFRTAAENHGRLAIPFDSGLQPGFTFQADLQLSALLLC